MVSLTLYCNLSSMAVAPNKIILVSISLIASSNVNHFTESIENELTIVTYLKTDVDDVEKLESSYTA